MLAVQLARVELLPLTPAQLREFFKRWFAADAQKLEKVLAHLRRNPRLCEVIQTPLLATVLAAIAAHNGTLPSALPELYDERLRLLLNDWDRARGIERDRFDYRDKRSFLQRFAMSLHRSEKRGTTWDSAVGIAAQLVGSLQDDRRVAEDFVRELANHNNVLVNDIEQGWGLGHLQYQEHLVAMEIVRQVPDDAVDHLEHGWWREVFRIYAEHTLDISPLIHVAKRTGDLAKCAKQLDYLLSSAPNTHRDLVRDVARALDRAYLYDEVPTGEDEASWIDDAPVEVDDFFSHPENERD